MLLSSPTLSVIPILTPSPCHGPVPPPPPLNSQSSPSSVPGKKAPLHSSLSVCMHLVSLGRQWAPWGAQLRCHPPSLWAPSTVGSCLPSKAHGALHLLQGASWTIRWVLGASSDLPQPPNQRYAMKLLTPASCLMGKPRRAGPASQKLLSGYQLSEQKAAAFFLPSPKSLGLCKCSPLCL